MYRLIIALLLLLCALPAAAAPTINCHCFQERSFDPARPDAADSYLLATTYNSFQAQLLGLSKKTLVKTKMSGGKDSDIWISGYLAKETGLSIEEIVSQRGASPSWGALAKAKGVALPAAGVEASNDEALARSIAIAAAADAFGAELKGLQRLGAGGASVKELVLAAFLGRLTGQAPKDLIGQVGSGKTSWGELATRADLPFGAVEERIAALLAASP